MLYIKAKEDLLTAVLATYKQYRDPGTSDLDDEQPVSLNVRTTLGHLRTLARFAELERAVGEGSGD